MKGKDEIMNEISNRLPYNYPDKLYYVCLELDLGILELQKTEDERDDCCIYKYEDELFDVGFDNIIEYVKEEAEEDRGVAGGTFCSWSECFRDDPYSMRVIF